MKLGVIGCGKMGSAIARAALRSRIGLVAYDSDFGKVRALVKLGAKAAKDAADAARRGDAVLIAVKPKDVAELLAQLKDACRGKLLVSIAAAVSTKFIEARVGKGCRVIRVMPNLPLEVGAGVACYCKGRGVKGRDAEVVKRIFSAAGICEKIDEGQMDAATVVGSSSPAFYALVIKAIADEGEKIGLGRKLALRLAAGACVGAGRVVLEGGKEPGEFANMVATPGGITAEGLAVLEKNGAWKIFREAVRKANEKSRRISASVK